jgi:cyclopropane fatty-acyl-phospholipid synthase-like methyltransferase
VAQTSTSGESVNLWRNADHARNYLEKRSSIPRRADAYEVLLEIMPVEVHRVLDLGTGDGNVLQMVLDARPGATGVGLDFQDEMLDRARERFADRPDVEIRRHDMEDPLPEDLGRFDVVVSSFAIHHLEPERQMALYGEVFEQLVPGGLFANVEHVASTTPKRHEEFLHALGSSPQQDDPSNKLVAVDAHLSGLNACGYADAECLWKWRELAVVTGTKPR